MMETHLMVDPPSVWRYGRYWEGERRILMDDYLVAMTVE